MFIYNFILYYKYNLFIIIYSCKLYININSNYNNNYNNIINIYKILFYIFQQIIIGKLLKIIK